MLSVYDEASVRQAVLEAGADGFLLKNAIASDLLPTIDDVLARKSETTPSGNQNESTHGRTEQGVEPREK
jgi:DNA-binding NarL/FixJ family response regulator